MINKLLIRNFKLFKEETEIPLSNINLFTGINGRGKSTVLQTFLLMKQSPVFDRTTNKLILNGEDVNLGSFKDIRNVRNIPIEFSFFYDEFVLKYQFEENLEDPMTANIQSILIKSLSEKNEFIYNINRIDDAYLVEKPSDKGFQSFPITIYDMFISDTALALNADQSDCKLVRDTINFSKTHYVSADREGPKLYYTDKSLKGFYTVGPRGEDTITVLYHSQNEPVGSEFLNNINQLFHVPAEELGATVGLQTQFWLDKLFNGAKYDIKPVEDANLLTFSISPDGSFNYYKPTNVGYGFSYVLPIIVAGLIAKQGDILIVENPEAHLHPSAQSVISKFLTLVSLNGVQVIIESHSEHILNGLRISVYNNVIESKHFNVLYFDRNIENYFKQISVDRKGGISDWPQDFFDQATKDLNYLFGI